MQHIVAGLIRNATLKYNLIVIESMLEHLLPKDLNQTFTFKNATHSNVPSPETSLALK